MAHELTNTEDGLSHYNVLDEEEINIQSFKLYVDGDYQILGILSGDVILVNRDYQKSKGPYINKIASALLHRDIFGPCILVDQGEKECLLEQHSL